MCVFDEILMRLGPDFSRFGQDLFKKRYFLSRDQMLDKIVFR